MSYPLKQSSTAQALVFLMVDSTDHITGKTGLSPTVTIRKAGGAFGSPSGSVTEISAGFYQVAGNATDTNTLGPLLLHAVGTGADPCDVVYHVVAYDPHDAVRAGLTALPNVNSGSAGAIITSGTGTAQLSVSSGLVTLAAVTHTGATIPTVTTLSNLPSIPNNWLTAAGINADAFTAAKFATDVGTEIGTAVWATTTRQLTSTQTFSLTGNITGNLSGSVGSIGTGGIASTSFAAGALNATAIATGAFTNPKFGAGALDASVIAADAFGASQLATDAATEIGAAVWATATRQLTGTQAFNLTGDITGDLSGSVGSVTGDVGGNVDGSVGSVASRVAANTDQIAGNATAATNLSAQMLAFVLGSVNDASATTTEFVGDSGLSTRDDDYLGMLCVPTSGTLRGIPRTVLNYVGSSRTFTFDVAWPAAPADATTFILIGKGGSPA